MSDGWRRRTLIPIYKNTRDTQSCANYNGLSSWIILRYVGEGNWAEIKTRLILPKINFVYYLGGRQWKQYTCYNNWWGDIWEIKKTYVWLISKRYTTGCQWWKALEKWIIYVAYIWAIKDIYEKVKSIKYKITTDLDQESVLSPFFSPSC